MKKTTTKKAVKSNKAKATKTTAKKVTKKNK